MIRRSRRWLLPAAVAMLGLGTGLAPGQQTKAKIDALPAFPVSGRVVNGKDGSPIAGAKVSLSWIQMHCTPYIGRPGDPLPDCALAAQYTPEFAPVMTDGAGQFFFPAVPEGSLVVRAEAKDFFVEWPIFRRPDDSLGSLRVTGPTRDVELRLLPAASLGGMVLDEADHPVANWEVNLSSTKVYGQGFTATFYDKSMRTGPDGAFAFHGIAPGDYFLNTEMRPATAAAAGDQRIYPPTLWPASEPGLASPRTVHLEPGGSALASLRVAPQPVHHVTGRFAPAPATEVDGFRTNVMAISEYGGWTYMQTVSRDRGAIDLALPDGRYKIVVQTADNAAQTIVQVAGGDVDGVSIKLGARVTVPVRFQVSGPSRQPPIPGRSIVQQATFGIQVMFAGDPERGHSFGAGTGIVDSAGRPDASGAASFNPRVPGRYLLVTDGPPPWYVASITSDGHNLAAEPYLITDKEHATEIDIELRSDGASVSGVVGRGESLAAAFVYALPTFPSTAMLRVATAHADGRYQLEGLAPGAYRILAFDHEVAIPFREDISAWLARGRAITMAAGSSTHLNLNLNLELEP